MRNAVNGVHRVVVLDIQQAVRSRFREKFSDGPNPDLGVNETAAIRHDVDFRFSYHPVQGVDLPVDVALADVVEIHQR